MKNLISKTVIILALTSPAITVLAATTDFNTNNETIISNTGQKSPGVDENSFSTLNYLNTETLADTLTTDAERKGWDGSIKGNSIESKHAISTKGTGGTINRSGVIAETGSAVPNQQSKKGITESGIKITENERKGWDGSVKGNSKGINQEGIKITDAERKGWDGSVKGNSKGITENGIKRTENQRKGWDGTVKGGNIQEESIRGINNPGDSMQQKANINTSRSNIKRGITNPTDSMQQKANINTSRSNIKRGMRNPADSLQQTEAGGMSNPYYKSNGNAGEMPAQLQRGIDKKDIRRGVRENADVNETTPADNLTQKETLQGNDGNATNQLQRKTKHDTAKNSVGNIR